MSDPPAPVPAPVSTLGPTPDLAPRRFWIALVLTVALGGALRLGLLRAFFPQRPVGDELYYLETATQIALGQGHARAGVPHANWPPFHSFCVSLFVDPSAPPGPAAIRPLLDFQVLVGTLVVLFVALLGRALFDRRTGLLAGAVAALYPTFIAFSHYLWSENLFVLLLCAALWAAVQVERSRRFGWVVLAGISFGLAGLTREVALLIAGGVALWWVATAPSTEAPPGSDEAQPGFAEAQPGFERRPAKGTRRPVNRSRRRAAGQGALMLTLAAAVVLPWTWRNYRLFERFVPVSSVSWMAMRQGNTFAKEDWTRPPVGRVRNFVEAYYADPDEMGRADGARREALELIRAEQPSWLFKKLVRNGAMLFSPDSFLFKKISRGAYPDLTPGQVRLALAATVLSYLGVVVAGVLGVASARGRGRRLFALGVIGIVVALHVVAVASPRYRLPLMPILMVYGSHAVLHARELRLSRAARWTCGLALAFFLGWCVPYFRADAVALWKRGTYVDAFRP